MPLEDLALMQRIDSVWPIEDCLDSEIGLTPVPSDAKPRLGLQFATTATDRLTAEIHLLFSCLCLNNRGQLCAILRDTRILESRCPD